jgi:hypothetical protein
VSAELDLTRLAELEETLGVELPQIVATLVEELDTAVADAQSSVGTGDLTAAALAAHAGRNSALMIGARPVLDALEALETRAGRGDVKGAGEALASLRSRWPVLRERLEAAARQGC